MDTSLLDWFESVREHNVSKSTAQRLEEQVHLAIKNQQHCDRLQALDRHLNDHPRGHTHIAEIETRFDVRFCARTRNWISNGIHRSWLGFVRSLSNAMSELRMFCDDDQAKISIAELLWEGTARVANGWHPPHESQEDHVADCIFKFIALPEITTMRVSIASMQSYLGVAVACLERFELRCGPNPRLSKTKLWHKKVNANAHEAVAMQRVLNHPLMRNEIPSSRAFAPILATSTKSLQPDELAFATQW